MPFVNTTKVRPVTGYHVLALVFVFFGTIIAVNITIAIKAHQSWSGLIVKSVWVEGQKFNTAKADAETVNDAGVLVELGYSAPNLQIQFSHDTPTAVDVGTLKVRVGRPATEKYDRMNVVSSSAPGYYQITSALQQGLWQVKLSSEINGVTFSRILNLYVDAQGQGRLL